MKPFKTRPVKGKVRPFRIPINIPDDLVVWWYGGLSKNLRAGSVPLVKVFFKRLRADGTLGDWVACDVGLTHLGILRIGSIWRDSVQCAEIVLTEHSLTIDFSDGKWRLISPAEAAAKRMLLPFSPADYGLRYWPDKNWLLDFPMSNGINLLVPCLEFYIRCFGRSEEARRIIATYPWDELTRRCFEPITEPSEPGTWQIKLSKEMRNSDTVFLAHALHDQYAQLKVKSIYAQLEASYAANNEYCFLKAVPWFQGMANFKVNGIWINGGSTFLALRVDGCSDPGGVPINRDRENTNKTDESSGNPNAPKAWNGMPPRVTKHLPEIIDLTDRGEPDHNAATVEIEENEFEVLGHKRIVLDVIRARAKTNPGTAALEGDDESFSTGESNGSGKGVGRASIHAPVSMESAGALREIWDAMWDLYDSNSEIVSGVESFSFDFGFSEDRAPTLVGLKSFEDGDRDRVGNDVMRWVYQDRMHAAMRGVLIARMIVYGKSIYVIEIQRRLRIVRDEKALVREKEENYKGLVFEADEASFYEWVDEFLSEVRYVRGIVEKLVFSCPGNAATFNHPHPSGGRSAGQAALENALGKVRLEVSTNDSSRTPSGAIPIN